MSLAGSFNVSNETLLILFVVSQIIIRSLSTPVTARQKILEESNRKLRRQLATLEEEYSKACSGDTIEKLKTELVKSKEDYKTLKKEATDDKVRAVNLVSIRFD